MGKFDECGNKVYTAMELDKDESTVKTHPLKEFNEENVRIGFEIYRDGGVKKDQRIVQKFLWKYKFDATKIVDILRCSYAFETIKDVYMAVWLAVKYFRKLNGQDETVGDPNDVCVWMKDRFYDPTDSGYRDIILMVKIPKSGGLWGELQFHLKRAVEYKKEMHPQYRRMRHFKQAENITKLVVDFQERYLERCRKFKEERPPMKLTRATTDNNQHLEVRPTLPLMRSRSSPDRPSIPRSRSNSLQSGGYESNVTPPSSPKLRLGRGRNSNPLQRTRKPGPNIPALSRSESEPQPNGKRVPATSEGNANGKRTPLLPKLDPAQRSLPLHPPTAPTKPALKRTTSLPTRRRRRLMRRLLHAENNPTNNTSYRKNLTPEAAGDQVRLGSPWEDLSEESTLRRRLNGS